MELAVVGPEAAATQAQGKVESWERRELGMFPKLIPQQTGKLGHGEEGCPGLHKASSKPGL